MNKEVAELNLKVLEIVKHASIVRDGATLNTLSVNEWIRSLGDDEYLVVMNGDKSIFDSFADYNQNQQCKGSSLRVDYELK